MKKLSRTFRRIAGAAIIIAIALFLALLLAPWFIKTAPIENKIRSVVAAHTGDAVTFQRVDLSLPPRPRLIVRSVGISFRGVRNSNNDHISARLFRFSVGGLRVAEGSAGTTQPCPEVSKNSEDNREEPVSLKEAGEESLP